MSEASVIDYLDVLAWPVLILALVGASLTLFRKNIEALIDRIRVIATPVGSVRISPVEQPEEVPALPEVNEPPPSEEPETPPPAPGTTVEQLWAYVYYWYYEKMYRLTYGTQTALLAYLNTLPTGADATQLTSYYAQHMQAAKALDPTYNREFLEYLRWLVTAQFVIQQDGRYLVTRIGVGFLAWMAAEGLGDKPGV